MDKPYPLMPVVWHPLRIECVKDDGSIRLEPAATLSMTPNETSVAIEGFYLAISPHITPFSRLVPASSQLDKLVRIEVTDVGEQQRLTAKSGPEAATALKEGDMVILVRPVRMTTTQIRSLPAVIPLLKEGDSKAPKSLLESLARARQTAQLSQSINNLKQLGLAMHNFCSAMNSFPPAIVFGPEGKPWHSWRVLILPYLGESQLFNEYDFTQPWDSPKNRLLLNKMPSVYRDPQNGGEPGSVTHFAALVGEKTVFPLSGSRITINNGVASNDLYKGLGIVNITDGTSNTIGIVPVDPARKIPWTKPEDITVGANFPALGQPGGIFTPIRIDGVGAAPVLFLDGSVRTISSQIDMATLHALTTIRGGEIINSSNITSPPNLRRPVSNGLPIMHLVRDGNKVSAIIEPAGGR